jgi:hypothetical protein
MVLLSPAMVGSFGALGFSSSLKIAQSSKVVDLLVFVVLGGLEGELAVFLYVGRAGSFPLSILLITPFP